MRTYLAPLGFDSRHVVRPVLSEDIDPGDRILLLQPATGSERSDDVFNEVEYILTQVVSDLDLETEALPYSNFVETTLYCVEFIQPADSETIVILGGGAREILFPLTVAIFSSVDSVDTILQVGDIESNVRRIPQLSLRGNVSDAEAGLLAEVDKIDAPRSISQIANEVGKSKSTVARHVSSLESEGFVSSEKDGRSKRISITDSGRVFFENVA